MNPYRFRAPPTFWASYRKLTPEQKTATKRAFQIFLKDPFDSRLRTHKINALSARAKRTIYSVVIAADLRALFFVCGDEIVSFDIGTHDDVYR